MLLALVPVNMQSPCANTSLYLYHSPAPVATFLLAYALHACMHADFIYRYIALHTHGVSVMHVPYPTPSYPPPPPTPPSPPKALKCCPLQSVKAKAQQAQQAKAAVSWQLTMAAKVADLLRNIVDHPLDHPPAATPGMHSHMMLLTLPSVTLKALTTPHGHVQFVGIHRCVNRVTPHGHAHCVGIHSSVSRVTLHVPILCRHSHSRRL